MFSKSICILISGKAGVGKTTSARMLKEIFIDEELNTEIFPFAFGVKQLASVGYGWDGNKDDRGRKLLQDVGRVGREYNQDIWCSTTFDKLIPNSKKYPFDVVLVDDWRYPNEYNFVSKNPLYSVYKLRIESPERELLKGTSLALDTSEISLPSGLDPYYDAIIYNLTLLDDLKDSLENFVRNIIFKKEIKY